jgi:hypothetical protein
MQSNQQKKKEECQLKILAISSDIEASISKIRVTTPLKSVQKNGTINIKFKSLHEVDGSDFMWADVSILQRDATQKSIKWLKLAKKLNNFVVFEIDDLLTATPEFLSHHHVTIRNREAIQYALSNADIISASTKRLADALKSITNQAIVLTPNYATPALYPAATHTPSSATEPVTMVVASSDSILIDFILPSLQKFIAANPTHRQIFTIGPLSEEISRHIPQAITRKTLSLAEFKKTISKLPNPIGIIPLDNSEFSNCKSAVKFFDYAMCGLPSICSNVPPYSDVIVNEEHGFLVKNDPDEWLACMEKLAASASLRTEICNNAKNLVEKNYSLDINKSGWQRIFAIALEQKNKKTPSTKNIQHYLRTIGLFIRYRTASRLLTLIKVANRRRIELRKAKQKT